MPPILLLAMLPLTVLLLRVRMTSYLYSTPLKMPPAVRAVLSLTVLFVKVRVPVL